MNEPRWLNEVFVPGARFFSDAAEQVVSIDPVTTVASFTLVRGPLMVTDPGYEPKIMRTLCVYADLPPGTYPLQVTTATCEIEFIGEPLVMCDEFATRLLVQDAPTVR